MTLINCSRCGFRMAEDDYMEDGVCGLCLLVEVTEELGLYENQGGVSEEEVDFARNQIDGPSVHEGP
ncbi:hypothetical protein SEA_PINKIEPIE_209 [Streptomyces phage PinkiePie]|nr:hypothetical protein SEA_SQUILLIUM_212 [Streptomyces phage Squillium]WNM73431.1 hypothetical protein SEA_LIANDRY_209 [Streptomyces phage Liandry]WNM74832.1 hypothetical protein SEA_PINKIEPIE_209 [Streptomyces phage PinkiePie]